MNILKTFEEFKKGLFTPETPLSALSEKTAGTIFSLRGASSALVLALLQMEKNGGDKKQKNRKPVLCAANSEADAVRLSRDTGFFLSMLGEGLESVFLLPEPDGPEVSGRRAEFSLVIGGANSKNKNRKIFFASKAALEAPLWPATELEENMIRLSYPGSFPRQELERRLAVMGYRPVPIVSLPGQFRMKGWILDIFPSGAEDPVRVEFFGDDVDSMKAFDVESQMHTKDIFSLRILPVKEPEAGLPPDLDSFKLFAFEKIEGAAFNLGETPEKPRFTILSSLPLKKEDAAASLQSVAPVSSLAGHGLLHNERRDVNQIPGAVKTLRNAGYEILFVLSSHSQAERVKNILWEDGLHIPIVEPEEVPSYPGGICATYMSQGLSSGFGLSNLLIVTDRELFGEKPAWKPMKKSRISGLIHTMDDLQPGDYIVHNDHGIGKFLGIAKQQADGASAELMIIDYADGARIYLPLYGIEKVHKYKNPEGAMPQLDRLGGKAWERRKTRAKKRLKEIAEALVKLYAERETSKGFSFSPDTEMHREFDSFFPYELTPDQARAVADIKNDMEGPRPMERLLCGDVGYGKTEVAMRAAFKAIYDGKQVIVLVPTTLLCEQHWRNFTRRFSAFPVKIDFASRFKRKPENLAAFEAFGKGETDILIGTHSILRAGIDFKNLGLLVIDEEHRFGVAQKERIKDFKKNVDVLLLTATPIPRTFQMALSGIRDLSVIETPPEERLAVKSNIAVFSKSVIEEAVSAELARGGQVFFVHNRIEDIEKIMRLIRDLFPTVRMGMAHGRMKESELEKVMIKFLDGELDLLLSTAIISAGLDIPTANTIIVDRADMMGLADLYQLRGRVGRGNLKAFAWFLIPGHDSITEDAKKRLEALEELSYLGAGFRVALKDLEIRGAGNMLGQEQSGYISDIGFEMYVEMLEKAVSELKGVPVKEREMPPVELKVDALIPDGYIEDVSLRIGFYRRIAAAYEGDELKKISGELAERFGPLPDEVKNLIQVMSLRIAAEAAQVASISQIGGKARFSFRPEASPPVDALLKEKDFSGKLRFMPEGSFEVLVSERKVLRDVASVLSHLTGSGDFVIF